MITTPPEFPEEPDPAPSGNRSELSKLATFFAVAFAIAFGLCTVSLNFNEKVGSIAIPISIMVEIASVAGLLIVGLVALLRSFRSDD
jgi:hypothetical protein